MKKHKKIFRLIAIGVVCVLLLIVACHYIVVWNASGKTYDNVETIPHNKVGLLLATSPITPGGAHNFYFDNRIKAADELYKAGKRRNSVAELSEDDRQTVHEEWQI